MSLSDAEIDRIRAELGYHILLPGAAPYITDRSLFTQVIQPNVEEGPTTTSATVVVVATTPTPVAITLASATGFAAGLQVVLDVDARRETATIQSLSGAVATVLLSLAHTGTYPVVATIGGAFIVRECLREIAATKRAMSGAGPGINGDVLAALVASAGGIKKVDEIEFFPGSTAYTSSSASSSGGAQFANGKAKLKYWRDELAAALGVDNMWNYLNGNCSQLEAY